MNNKNVISFGKHKGKKYQEVPPKYLLWCAENIDNIYIKYPDLYEYIELAILPQIDLIEGFEYD